MGTYSTRKVALERTSLDEAKVPVTLVRPAAISGQVPAARGDSGSRSRCCTGAPQCNGRREPEPVPPDLGRQHRGARARRGGSPGTSRLNIGDPTAPTMSDIADSVPDHLGFSGLSVDDDAYPPTVGRTP